MNGNNLMGAISRGLIADAVGTIAMTLTKRLEIAISGRTASQVPGQVGAHLLPGRDPAAPLDVQQLNGPVHWAHGIIMGVLRGALDLAGIQGTKATAAHFALIWAGDAALYRVLGVTDVPWRWTGDQLAADMLHKGVHAVVTGAVCDALARPTN